MDSFADRLRALMGNKYFALAAVIFFAFITALVFSLLALQQRIPQSPEDIRATIQQNTSASSRSGVTPSGRKPSAFDSFVSALTGKKAAQSPSDQVATSQNSQNTDSTKDQASGSSTTQIARAQANFIKKIQNSSQDAPTINIKRPILVTKLPEKPATAKVYTLQTDLTEDMMNDLAAKLNFGKVQGIEKGAVLTQMYNIDSKNYLAINPKSGRFTYLSETGFAPEIPSSSPLQLAKNVATQLGLDDPSIKPFATYQRSDDNGDFTYVELHSDWDTFGRPILNPVGMLNMFETNSLSQINVGSLQNAPLENKNITNTSDGKDGYARSDDFNTITVKYRPTDGRVYGVSSNIPRIVASENAPADTIKTPTQAFDEFSQGKSQIALTGPVGAGVADLHDIYGDNVATAQSVDVTDASIIYAASPHIMPRYWCPVYVFRSFGKVQTGFKVQFVHTVPAVSDPRCSEAVLGSTTTRKLAQAAPSQTAQTTVVPSGGVVLTPIVGKTKEGDSLQYGTAAFVYDVIVNTPINACPADFNHSYKIADTKDTTEYIMWEDANTTTHSKTFGAGITPRVWYHVTFQKAGSTAELTSLDPKVNYGNVLQLRLSAIAQCTIGSSGMCPVDKSTQGLQVVSCTYITTGSPWIHVYPSAKQKVKVQIAPIGDTSFAQPNFTSGAEQTWDFTAEPTGKLSFEDGTSADSLHWEYNKYAVLKAYRPFRSPQQPGFVIASESLKPFVAELGSRMGLTSAETADLLAEFNRSSNAITTPYVKIGFVPQEFLSTYMPLHITPEPQNINRVFLDIQPLTSFENVPQPTLPHVNHEGSTAVETGMIVGN